MHISRVRLILLLVLFAAPGGTAALSVAGSDTGLEEPRRGDVPSTPSVWDSPADVTAAPANSAVSRQAQPAERALSPNPLWAIPLATLETTRERPVFSPSRRPPPAVDIPVAAAPPPPPPAKSVRIEPPQLSLVGTVSGDDQSFGIFVDQSTRTALRLRLGEDYQGWRLRSVQGREVTLEREQQTTSFSLPEPGAEGAAMPAPVQAENTNFDDEADPVARRGPH
jgi:hypothetical protein